MSQRKETSSTNFANSGNMFGSFRTRGGGRGALLNLALKEKATPESVYFLYSSIKIPH